jgi:hypothetical protein
LSHGAQITLRFEALLGSGAQVQLRPALEAYSVDIAGSRYIENTQQVGIAEEELFFGDVVPGGLVLLTNRGSDTDWIDLRAESGGANFTRLLPGVTQFYQFTPGVRPYVIASADYIDLELLMLEA